MAELSKTARASMGKQVKEVHVETTEEAIKAIRVNREAGLFVGDMSRVDKLLAEYDRVLTELKTMAKAATKLVDVLIPGAVVPMETVVMATIPNHELDHTDFGHHTTHPVAEGA